jgi:hypothetical protein
MQAAKRRRETGWPRKGVAAPALRRQPTPLAVVRRRLMPPLPVRVGAGAEMRPLPQHSPHRLRHAGRRSAAADARARP